MKDGLHRMNILQKIIDEKEAYLSAPTSSWPLAYIMLWLRSALLAPSRTVRRPISLQIQTKYELFIQKAQVISADCILDQLDCIRNGLNWYVISFQPTL